MKVKTIISTRRIQKELKLLSERLCFIQQLIDRKRAKMPSHMKFNCDSCKKEIDGKFIKIETFDNMQNWWDSDCSGYIKVYHIECWNRMLKK